MPSVRPSAFTRLKSSYINSAMQASSKDRELRSTGSRYSTWIRGASCALFAIVFLPKLRRFAEGTIALTWTPLQNPVAATTSCLERGDDLVARPRMIPDLSDLNAKDCSKCGPTNWGPQGACFTRSTHAV